MSIVKKIAHLLGLAKEGASWAENELSKGLQEAETIAAKVFGSKAVQLVFAAAVQLDPITGAVLSDAEKLFYVAKGLVDFAKSLSANMPFATAIQLAQNAYDQAEKDAEQAVADVRAFIEQAKKLDASKVAAAIATTAIAQTA